MFTSHYVINLIKKLEMHLMVVPIFLKIKLGMPKLVCPKSVYPCQKQPVSIPDLTDLPYIA